MLERSKLPLRPNVCILLHNHKGELFLGERTNEPGHWQFPQGGAEPELSLEDNVRKELNEELGLKRRAIGKILQLHSTYEYEWDSPPSYAKSRWRGQSQTFWLVEFTGADADIDLTADKKPEFSQWCWCTIHELDQLAPPRRMAAYAGALREYADYLKDRTGVAGKHR